MHGLHSSVEKGKKIIHIHTPTYTLFNMDFIVLFSTLSSIIFIILNRSSSIHHPHQKSGGTLVSPSPSWVACQLQQLLAQPLCLAALLLQSPETGQRLAQPTTKAKAWLTFGVQEVKGSSHILYHAAGLSLIEVLPLLDVGQDGAWEAEEHREMPFQALLNITCQRPSVNRFVWGTKAYSLLNVQHQEWFQAQRRYQHKTAMNRTELLTSVPVYDEYRRE